MRKVIYIVLVLFLFACGEKKTSFKDMKEWEAYVNDPDNGFIVSEETSDLKFDLKFMPAISGDEMPQFTCHLRISRKDGGSVLDFNTTSKEEALSREGYLSFELLKDVSIEENGHASPAIFHHYERNYGLKPTIDIMFNFMQMEPKNDVYFVYRDDLFGQGLIRIKLNKELFTKCYVKNA
jgi:hypothetical protein